MVQLLTTLPNSSLKFSKITVARPYLLLKTVQISFIKLKNLSINPEKETLIQFDVSALFTNIPVPVALEVINNKISTHANFTNICKTPMGKKSSNSYRLYNHHLCLLLQQQILQAITGYSHTFPCLPVTANIYMNTLNP